MARRTHIDHLLDRRGITKKQHAKLKAEEEARKHETETTAAKIAQAAIEKAMRPNATEISGDQRESAGLSGYASQHWRNNMTKEERESFKQAALPLIKWLCENVHPHHTAIVTCTDAQLLEGSCATGMILDYVRD